LLRLTENKFLKSKVKVKSWRTENFLVVSNFKILIKENNKIVIFERQEIFLSLFVWINFKAKTSFAASFSLF
jgi:hypothetical protein